MIDFTIETAIGRPVGEVFAYATDPAKLGSWQTNTVSAVPEDEGPVRLGTRIREVHSGPGGRRFASLVEVSEYEPDRVFALRMLEGAVPIHAHISFAARGSGTLLRFRVFGSLSGAKRLAQPLLTATLRRQFARDCATLKRVLEKRSGG